MVDYIDISWTSRTCLSRVRKALLHAPFLLAPLQPLPTHDSWCLICVFSLIRWRRPVSGWRRTMEDAHTAQIDVDGEGSAIFGVFDGHGGAEVARYAAKHLHQVLLNNDNFKGGRVEQALVESYLK